jgi:hypothetical protein
MVNAQKCFAKAQQGQVEQKGCLPWTSISVGVNQRSYWRSEATAAAASFLYKTRCSGLPFQQLQQLPDTYTIKKKETFFNTKSREDSERGAHALLL